MNSIEIDSILIEIQKKKDKSIQEFDSINYSES